ncbi:MoaA/NifB/PqqE/SkfB family radical SAM enzyme [Kitasatospora gansuensis]|uniref:MoaA/NifB/PqqE/SkfB family radical SAM enzyme n=1 Tax=Kitasatospora gansuensis TaxID=258050 RepID=A0A7W7S638_9ACTN|nr:radical SAM protein [Kitasatospora gansuensis]MBB4944598.1 MoaA/NifB/PqqE/SkfB family radical SAM enzyme [Kitasatospora gansuensis]
MSKLPELRRVNRISLQVNEVCDSRCRLCDYWRLENPKSMSAEVFQALVLPTLRGLSPLENICVTGGEPTLHPDLPAMLTALAEVSRTLTLITSTSGLDAVYEGIRPLISTYMVSMDGADRATYRRTRGVDLFDGAFGWVRRLRAETAATIAVSFVIQQENFDQLEAVAERSFAEGAHCVFLRVPSLTDDGFGRDGVVPLRTERAGVLTDGQIAVVTRQLAAIAGKYTREQIPNVLDYGRFVRNLRGEQPAVGLTCDVPFTSMVIDPQGHYLPCFYLPFRADLRDPQAATGLQREIQLSVLEDPGFRARHCDGCQQYVDRKWESRELNAEFHRQTLSAAAS